MGKKIIAAGMACLDITPVFESMQKRTIEEIFRPGKLIDVGSAQMHPGGSVLNTGFAFHYFGASLTLMAKVGDDPFGTMIKNIIDTAGVDHCITTTKDFGTGYSIVLAPPGIDRMFLHYRGANDAFGYNDIDFTKVAEADLFHLGYPTIMKKLYQNTDELIAIFKEAKRLHTMTSLDLAAIEENTEAAGVDWCRVFQELLPYVDYFVPSVEELCFLIDRPRYKEWLQRANGRDLVEVLDWEKDVRVLGDKLMALGAHVVLIKCGIKGLYLRTNGLDGKWKNIEYFEQSYKAEHFCSATGAGDVTIAAFLTAMLHDYEPKRCLQLAAGAGACCVRAYDALSGLLPIKEMLTKIENGWKKNE